ncbi:MULTISPECIES: hypothetical protein [Vibrio]|uniref:hypothetical protein n=1 Tax=Vibrio TaxID=662 RepID=UPI000DE349B8|nr:MULTISPECIES: hypothetical protein [Vibrio]EGR1130024.1 hypothetical protein [Vibrio cholerae]EGR2027023.1 hypothetical protein [Vibrio cholerae]EGR4199729.1 hypothetical protein [Vibrio cholerae]EHP5030844.1 hypothetical protein [Vibrio cholerae]EJI2332285.1 hypothetical protein [Vibrio cholerae]
MDLTLVAKLVPAVVGIIGGGKVIYELVSGVQSKLREEYKFAKEFLDDGNLKNLHPFAIAKGYQAIVGSTLVTQKEAEYILSLSNPVQRLNDFKKSLQLFEKMDTKGEFELVFKSKYKANWSRNWRKAFYLFWYFTLAFIALSPIVFPEWFGEQGILAIIMTLPAFGFYAWGAMNAYSKIKAAERLVENKERHTSRIVVASQT